MVYLKLLHCRFEKRTRIVYTIMLGFTMIILLFTAIYDAHLIHFVRNRSKTDWKSSDTAAQYDAPFKCKICWSIHKVGVFLVKMKSKFLGGIQFYCFLNISWLLPYLQMSLTCSQKKYQFGIFRMKAGFLKIDWITLHLFSIIKDFQDHLNLSFISIKQDRFKL